MHHRPLGREIERRRKASYWSRRPYRKNCHRRDYDHHQQSDKTNEAWLHDRAC
jgi:hypothetical protein